MDRALPDGRVIGSLSSGHVSVTATRHRVVNLDGLVNSRDYFDNYLSRHRLPEYLEREGVDYFSDYQGVSTWRNGIRWRGFVPRDSLELAWWARMDGDRAYCVWRLPGARPIGAGAYDALSRIQFSAVVEGRWQVTSDVHEVDSSDRVLTSSASYPSGDLLHVVVPREMDGVALSRERVWPDVASSADWGPLRLLGLDLPSRSIERRRPLVITLYWELRREFERTPPVASSIVIREVGVGGPWRRLRLGAPAHGTWPFHEWRVGEVVAETYSFDLTRRDRGREFELAVSVPGWRSEPTVVGRFSLSR